MPADVHRRSVAAGDRWSERDLVGDVDTRGPIPRARLGRADGESLPDFMARIAASTRFAYDIPLGQFEDQPDFAFDVDSAVFARAAFMIGTVRGRVHMIRSADLVAASAVDLLFVYIPLAGTMKLKAGRRSQVAGVGDIVVHDLNHPADVLLDGYTLMTLVIERSALEAEARRRELNGLLVRAADPLARIIVATLRLLHAEAERMRPLDATAVLDQALVLLSRAFAAGSVAGDIPLSLRAATAVIIDARLGDVALSPEHVAAELGVSRATLYRAFQSYGGVRRLIADRRLHLAWSLAVAKPPVEAQAICRRVGYASPSRLNEALVALCGAPLKAIQAASGAARDALLAHGETLVDTNRRRLTH